MRAGFFVFRSSTGVFPSCQADLETTLTAILSPEEIPAAISRRRKKYEEVYLEKTRLLEDKLRELIGFGEENDAVSGKVHRLACRLLEAGGLDATLDAAYLDLLDHFAVPHVAVRLWGVAESDPEAKEFGEVAAEMRDFVAQMAAPYCGSHAVYESQAWFGDAAPHLRSFALVALRARSAYQGTLEEGAYTFGQRLYIGSQKLFTYYLARTLFPGWVGTDTLTRRFRTPLQVPCDSGAPSPPSSPMARPGPGGESGPYAMSAAGGR